MTLPAADFQCILPSTSEFIPIATDIGFDSSFPSFQVPMTESEFNWTPVSATAPDSQSPFLEPGQRLPPTPESPEVHTQLQSNEHETIAASGE